MRYFADSLLLPFIKESNYRHFCEIGANEGENTEKLLELSGGSFAVVDPFPADSLLRMCKDERVTLFRENSLPALQHMTQPFDCILIDGDHNWYTVHNELKTIYDRKLLTSRGAIFFHDVAWPYARRDMYYSPETVPADYRQPHEKKGIRQGVPALCSDTEFNAGHWNAINEGGSRNGVLTAIEDFISEHPGEFRFTRIGAEFGLGILVYSHSSTSPAYLKLIAKGRLLSFKDRVRRVGREHFPGLRRAFLKVAR